jgi:hypothetical protein
MVSGHPRLMNKRFAAGALAVGSAMFSGSIYGMVWLKTKNIQSGKILGPITPLGGIQSFECLLMIRIDHDRRMDRFDLLSICKWVNSEGFRCVDRGNWRDGGTRSRRTVPTGCIYRIIEYQISTTFFDRLRCVAQLVYLGRSDLVRIITPSKCLYLRFEIETRL